MVIEAKYISEILETRQPLWMATLGVETMTSSRYLIQHHWIEDGKILAAEIYAVRGSDERYARIYGTPDEKHVPTLMFGEIGTVGEVAYREGHVIVPLHPPVHLELGQVILMYPDELLDIPGIKDVVSKIRKPAFAVRPSTFVLTEQRPIDLAGIEAVAKIHRNLLVGANPAEFFAHVFARDEVNPLTPNVRGYVVTNSETYIHNHKEFSFHSLKEKEEGS